MRRSWRTYAAALIAEEAGARWVRSHGMFWYGPLITDETLARVNGELTVLRPRNGGPSATCPDQCDLTRGIEV